MENNNMSAPEIRFPGFTDPWEQRKLGEVVDVCSGRDYKHLSAGDIPVYGTGGYMLSVSEALSQNDAIGIGRKGTIDNPYILKAPFWTIDTLFYCIPKDCDLDFIYGLYQTINWRSMDESTGVPSLSKTAINDVDICIPSKGEQLHIGRCFASIDNLITLHQCKYYQHHIGNRKRKIIFSFRFNTIAWEQRKLGEILEDMYNGQTPSRANPNYWNGKIKWLSSGELNRGLITQCSESITEEGQKSANLRVVPKGTFIMAITGLEAAGTRGNCGILGFDTTMNQSCMALFPNRNKLCPEFLFQWYMMIGEEYGIRFTQGTKQQSYNAEIIKELAICLPKIEEQKQLAELLFCLDNLITLHQRKCDELKSYKKGLLQKMFV